MRRCAAARAGETPEFIAPFTTSTPCTGGFRGFFLGRHPLAVQLILRLIQFSNVFERLSFALLAIAWTALAFQHVFQ
jgi:hypothetical protein